MEQRYQAVLAVIRDGVPVVEVASRFGVSRQAVHRWLRWYEDQGLVGLVDRSHRPVRCSHQMEPAIEVWVLETRRRNPDWGPRRLVHEATRAGLVPVPSRSGVYRALKRAQLIDPEARRRRDRRFKRWERGGSMELWQMDVVGGVLLADGTQCKVLTGIDDHSRFIVCAGVMARATSRAVCAHFAAAMRAHGVPQEILTDNGKVFTGRFGLKDTEVLFDRICRENGIDHLLTAPPAPRRPARSSGSTARFAPSSSPGGPSPTSRPLRPSSTAGSRATTTSVHIKPWPWRPQLAGSSPPCRTDEPTRRRSGLSAPAKSGSPARSRRTA